MKFSYLCVRRKNPVTGFIEEQTVNNNETDRNDIEVNAFYFLWAITIIKKLKSRILNTDERPRLEERLTANMIDRDIKVALRQSVPEKSMT